MQGGEFSGTLGRHLHEQDKAMDETGDAIGIKCRPEKSFYAAAGDVETRGNRAPCACAPVW